MENKVVQKMKTVFVIVCIMTVSLLHKPLLGYGQKGGVASLHGDDCISQKPPSNIFASWKLKILITQVSFHV